MRLTSPKIKCLVSADGIGRIQFRDTQSSRDLGGDVYTFEFKWPAAVGGEINGIAIIGSHTSMRARAYYEKAGIDTLDLNWQERNKYIDEYKKKYGATYTVKEFVVKDYEPTGVELVEIRDLFLSLYHRLGSSFEFNHSDPNSDPDAYYPDTIDFQPYNLEREFYVSIMATEAKIND